MPLPSTLCADSQDQDMGLILVTGGAGYIGSHTLRALIERGHSCVVVDNLSNGHKESLPEVIFYQTDVRDRASLRPIFMKHNFSAVIHLAGLALVEESFRCEQDYFDHNVNGTNVLLDLCCEFGIRNFVFSSSSTIYGDANSNEKLTETHALAPMSPYGHTKLLCEERIAKSDLNYFILRYFNVAGASSDLSNGPRGTGSQRVFFNITKAAVLGSDFVVHGSDYPTSDGTCVRDYIHVEDIADIHVKAVEHLLGVGITDSAVAAGAGAGASFTASCQKIFNCGYGVGFSVKQIVESYKKFNEVDFKVTWGARRQGDPAYLVGDNTELVRVLGWKSRFSNPLEAICRSMFEWEKNLIGKNRL